MTDVGVRGRHMGIARMQHQRYADRTPRGPGQLRPRRARRRRQRRAGYIGKTDPGLLEHAAVAQDPRTSAAALLTQPRVLDETRAAIDGFDRAADAVLQAGEVIADTVELAHGDILASRHGTPTRLRADTMGNVRRSTAGLRVDLGLLLFG